jgi:uncharacterized protein YggE
VIRITDAPQPRFRQPVPMAMERGIASAAAAPETPIEAGTIEIRAQVEMVAAFK